MTDARTIAAARKFYEEHTRRNFNVAEPGDSFLPREGLRTLRWDEIPEEAQERLYCGPMEMALAAAGTAPAEEAEVERYARDLEEDAAEIPNPNLSERLRDTATAIRRQAARIAELERRTDAEMERVKACEHIAEGMDGWEVVRNLCPSTAAVAGLRDAFTTLTAERDAAREALVNMIGLAVPHFTDDAQLLALKEARAALESPTTKRKTS